MRETITGIIIIAVVVFIFIFANKPDGATTDQLNSSERIVIKQESTQKLLSKKIKAKKETHKKLFNWLEGYDKESDQTPNVGLIQAFREFRKVKRCRFIIENNTNKTDAYQDFINRRNRIQLPENKKSLSLIQRQYFNIWAQSCRQLMDSDIELYTTVHERFRKRFYQTKAITQIEKDFAESWPLKEETRFIHFKYDYLIKGYDTNNKQLVNQMNKQIRYIENMLGYIHINDDIEFSTRTADEINMYNRQLAELIGIVDGSIAVDDNYLVNLYQVYESNIQTLDTFLKHNISSEAFLTLAPQFFKHKHLEIGYYDARYYLSVLPQILQLYACSMDAQCDAESKTMVKECFMSQYNANEIACGLSTEEYFLGYYFSPNQLTDVDQFINYLFENYAQN